ncbi:MAG TPA: hypothetical protein VGR56_05005 [Nitrososphaerales archaeon]|nr:hypothetical protein [Nitrososphaerales archaeon]
MTKAKTPPSWSGMSRVPAHETGDGERVNRAMRISAAARTSART